MCKQRANTYLISATKATFRETAKRFAGTKKDDFARIQRHATIGQVNIGNESKTYAKVK